jgi:hypothetical protein
MAEERAAADEQEEGRGRFERSMPGSWREDDATRMTGGPRDEEDGIDCEVRLSDHIEGTGGRGLREEAVMQRRDGNAQLRETEPQEG